jgi:hypothetical protein
VIAEYQAKIAAILTTAGFEVQPLVRGAADQPGVYLIFAEQILKERPKADETRFELFIVRSDLEGNAGAYADIDRLFAVKAAGIRVGGARLHSYRDGLYTYKADIYAVSSVY